MKSLTCISVDDDPLFLSFLTSLIEEIEWLDLKGKYSNPVKAASAIIKEEPEVLFMDLEMPYMDGYGLAEWISPRLKQFKNHPIIIVVSGNESFEDRQELNISKFIRKDKVLDKASFESMLLEVIHL